MTRSSLVHNRLGICSLLIASSFAWLSAGCNEKHDSNTTLRSESDGIENQANQTADGGRGTADMNVIRSGYGIPNCHIGMSVRDLDDTWERHEEDAGEGYVSNPELGIDANYQDERICAVFYYFLHGNTVPFVGETMKGVSSRSNIEDIRSVYGNPSYIMRSRRSDLEEFSGEVELRVNYVEAGICFQIVAGKLFIISVSVPNNQFDYESLQEKLGDKLDFIRASSDRGKP